MYFSPHAFSLTLKASNFVFGYSLISMQAKRKNRKSNTVFSRPKQLLVQASELLAKALILLVRESFFPCFALVLRSLAGILPQCCTICSPHHSNNKATAFLPSVSSHSQRAKSCQATLYSSTKLLPILSVIINSQHIA